MKRFWLKGFLLIALVLAPLALHTLQSRGRQALRGDEDEGRLSFTNEEHETEARGTEAKGMAWYMSQRTYGLGYIPPEAELRAVEYVRTRMLPEQALQSTRLQKSTAAQLRWEYQGPGNIGGRMRSFVVHPTNPNILYAGSVAGGVWKSTNAGANWLPTMNDLITLNIGALAMKPGDPNTLYAGTGEGFFSFDLQSGRGLLKTTDGGQTWRRIHKANGLNAPFIMALAVSPANPNVVYAAGREALPQASFSRSAETYPEGGVSAIFKSIDSGENWQDMTTGKGIEHTPGVLSDELPTEVLVSPNDANVVYATFGLFYWGGIWKSTNGGESWSRLRNGLPDPSATNLGYSRIKLALAPSNPNILYASFTYLSKPGDNANLLDGAALGVWKSTDAGQSWTRMGTPVTSNQFNRSLGYTTALGYQGEFAHALAVHPTDPNIVFLGGLDIYKSTNSGATWSQVSMWIAPGNPENPENLPYVHGDHHALVFETATNPPTLYDASDGGVARSRDLGKSWEILNHDLGVTQFYTFAVHPTDPNIMIGGTQDNGLPMSRNAQRNDWSNVNATSDGWQVYFDHADPTRIYVSQQEVGMGRVVFDYATGRIVEGKPIGSNHGANGITQRDVAKAGYYAPFELSPNNPNMLILGTNRLLQSTNRGDSWVPLSTEVDTALVAVAIAEGNDKIIWFATLKQIFKTEDGGATYANVTGANLPKRYLTDIEFDPANNRNVYVTYSGYGRPHVFKTTNAGASWADITNNLPDAPANTIQVHPQNSNMLFLGTDVGVFLSENGGQTWQPCTNGLPTVQVAALQLHLKTNRVYAATHGRGIYSAEIPSSAAALSVSVNELQIPTKPGQTGEVSFTIANTGNADLNFSIATSGGQAGALRGNAEAASASLVKPQTLAAPRLLANVPQGRKPMQEVPRLAGIAQATPLASLSSDMYVLDDGNDLPDDFIGEGPNSFNRFYWMNQFDPAQDYVLEGFHLYMRTEALNNNTIEIAVMDNALRDIVRGDVSMTTAPSGGWFTLTLTKTIAFSAGSTFFVEVGGNVAIAYPAGADKNAQVANRSFHYNWATGEYEALGTVGGFEQGAYLIRAFGTKSGGTNLPPVAQRQISKTQAKVNEAITFDASTSYDPDGQIVQYAWDFGDNTSSNQKIATHAYTRAGNFSPKLTVTDDKGATGQTIAFITISPGEASRFAVAPSTGTIASNGVQAIKVTFNAQGLAEGTYQGQVLITSNGGNKTLPVQVRVSNTPTDVEASASALPHAFALAQNYPNPFAASERFGTIIKYELPERAQVELRIYDLSGRQVATLAAGMHEAGTHEVPWHGRDAMGHALTRGVYFYQWQATTARGNTYRFTKKLTLL